VTLGDKEVDKIGADESGPAGDENFHAWVDEALL
jgi:hypothetical protein